jgi:hypothetical protein
VPRRLPESQNAAVAVVFVDEGSGLGVLERPCEKIRERECQMIRERGR